MTPTLWMLLSTLLFAILGAIVKLLHRLSVWEVVFFRAFFNFLWLLPWVQQNPDPSWRKEIKYLLVRGVSGFTSMVLYFYALEHLNLADAVMLNYSSPIPTMVLSAFFLGEVLSITAMVFVGIAFVGIALILKPSFAVADFAGIAGVLSAFAAAVAYVSMKMATKNINPRFIVFTFATISSILCFVPMLLTFQPPTNQEWLLIFTLGVTATFAQIAMTKAYAGLPASVASPLLLVTVLVSALIGWITFNEVPALITVAGGLLVVGGLIGAHRFRR